jgi:hypothetical protein
VPAIISSERESRGVTVIGVDPELERSLDAIGSNIAAGRNLEDRNDGGVVIGRKLADTLDTELGKRIVLMSQDPDNEIADRGYRVVGLFEANLEQQSKTRSAKLPSWRPITATWKGRPAEWQNSQAATWKCCHGSSSTPIWAACSTSWTASCWSG